MKTRRQRQAEFNRRRTIEADEGLVLVRSVRRRVRLTVVMRHAVTAVSGPDIIASAHLDEAAVDRLVRRLQNVRGGKAARKPKTKHWPPATISCSCGSCVICSGGPF